MYCCLWYLYWLLLWLQQQPLIAASATVQQPHIQREEALLLLCLSPSPSVPHGTGAEGERCMLCSGHPSPSPTVPLRNRFSVGAHGPLISWSGPPLLLSPAKEEGGGEVGGEGPRTGGEGGEGSMQEIQEGALPWVPPLLAIALSQRLTMNKVFHRKVTDPGSINLWHTEITFNICQQIPSNFWGRYLLAAETVVDDINSSNDLNSSLCYG